MSFLTFHTSKLISNFHPFSAATPANASKRALFVTERQTVLMVTMKRCVAIQVTFNAPAIKSVYLKASFAMDGIIALMVLMSQTSIARQ